MLISRGAVMAGAGPDDGGAVARRVPSLSSADRADHRADRTSPCSSGRGDPRQRQDRQPVRMPHADIIVKGGREEVQYGQKLNLTTGRSGLILDLVNRGRQSGDSERFLPMLNTPHRLLWRGRRDRAVADGGFASRHNLGEAKALGVRDVAFHKKAGLRVMDMVKSNWVYQKLRNFRAGFESEISCLKRAYCLARCIWRGIDHFQGIRLVVSRRLQPCSFCPAQARADRSIPSLIKPSPSTDLSSDRTRMALPLRQRRLIAVRGNPTQRKKLPTLSRDVHPRLFLKIKQSFMDTH